MVSQKTKYCKSFERNSHWRKLSMLMVWERYCNASPKPEFFLFSLFIFSFISELIWVRLGWKFHRWFSMQKQVNWYTIDQDFLFEVLHKPTLLPSIFKFCIPIKRCLYHYKLPRITSWLIHWRGETLWLSDQKSHSQSLTELCIYLNKLHIYLNTCIKTWNKPCVDLLSTIRVQLISHYWEFSTEQTCKPKQDEQYQKINSCVKANYVWGF